MYPSNGVSPGIRCGITAVILMRVHTGFFGFFSSLCDGQREEWLNTIRLIAGNSLAVIYDLSLLRILGIVMGNLPFKIFCLVLNAMGKQIHLKIQSIYALRIWLQ
jgi:hypothetical protein